MATLGLTQVSKVFHNGVEAVKNLDLFIEDGEFVVLVGPSGCGKTTVLRMVAGLEEVTSGTIDLNGVTANDMSPGDRDIAMVFQNYALYPHLNVRQNIGFSLAVRKVPKGERDEKVQAAARLLGLSELLDSKPRHLSGGQRQRVAMGRALVREPAVFLMDEPLSNLDASLRVQMRSEVMHIQKRLGVATMYVTHDQTEAMTMGDRVAVMRSGVLQQFAPPQELYDHPANIFVASFMGSPAMNLFHARLEHNGTHDELVLGSQRLTLGGGLRPDVSPDMTHGQEVVVGVRPEDLTPEAEQEHAGGERCVLVADVDLVEALGNEQLVHFAIDAPNFRDKAAQPLKSDAPEEVTTRMSGSATGKGVARVDPRLQISRSQRLAFKIDAGRLHFFDPDEGRALNVQQATPAAGNADLPNPPIPRQLPRIGARADASGRTQSS